MFFEVVETSFVQQLTGKLGTGILVEKLPESEAEFKRTFEKGKVSVCYIASDFNTPKSTGYTVQQEDAQFELVITSRTLRGTGGIYDIFNKTRNAVIGFMPPNCGRVYGVSFKFEKREEGLWSYVFTVATRSEMVMMADEPDTIPEWAALPGQQPGVVNITQITTENAIITTE